MVLGLETNQGFETEISKIFMNRSPSVLLDTHIFLWILSESKRLREVKWLSEYSYWTLSPISLLEIKFLQEIGRIDLDLSGVLLNLKKDSRFKIDNVSLEPLCFAALDITWTRDPFDRLLVAHSLCRGLPLGTCDKLIRKEYSSAV